MVVLQIRMVKVVQYEKHDIPHIHHTYIHHADIYCTHEYVHITSMSNVIPKQDPDYICIGNSTVRRVCV